MSQPYNLISCEDKKLIANIETLEYLKSIKEKVIIIGLISTTNDDSDTKFNSDLIKISLLSNILNNKDLSPNPNPQNVILYPTSLEKDNFNTKIFVLDINISNNKHIFSLCFFICSLFVFCFNENLNSDELKKFDIINSLFDTIKLKSKNDAQKLNLFSENSPKLICYIPNSKLSFSNYYLEEQLSKKDENKNINLIKENISKYFPKKELISENSEKNIILIQKIIEKANPKQINGKLFDGNALAFFVQNFCEMHNKKTNPDFELLLGNVIYNDLETFKSNSLKYFEENINLLENDNEEILIPKIYDIKLKSIEIYNNIQSLNYKVFNKLEYNEYKTSFNAMKKELEKKFTELENKKLIDNLKKSELICNELLNKHYEIINKKINNGEYNKENTDEYIQDYKIFLNAYEKEAKGNNKIKYLINFLEIQKPKYFKSLLFNENKKIEENKENIEEIKNKLNRKKREINNLKEQINKVEEDMKKKQTVENDV
jgi:hypothetical protein